MFQGWKKEKAELDHTIHLLHLAVVEIMPVPVGVMELGVVAPTIITPRMIRQLRLRFPEPNPMSHTEAVANRTTTTVTTAMAQATIMLTSSKQSFMIHPLPPLIRDHITILKMITINTQPILNPYSSSHMQVRR